MGSLSLVTGFHFFYFSFISFIPFFFSFLYIIFYLYILLEFSSHSTLLYHVP
ncbi:hypothetical protein BDW67DRAFT_131971 [Aspergillus spinulosporus]